MRFVLRRLLVMVPTLWVIATLTFFLMRLAPGGPFQSERDIPAEAKAALTAKYGLDPPLDVQYGRFLANAARLDFGPSYKFPARRCARSSSRRFRSRQLGGWALLLALPLGIPIGVLAALKQNTAWDHAAHGARAGRRLDPQLRARAAAGAASSR